jgi:hypothetical protein
MSLLLSLAVAVPFACLALLSLLDLVGIMALAGVIHMLGAARRSPEARPRVDRARLLAGRRRTMAIDQAACRRRRHQPRRPPLAKIRPGMNHLTVPTAMRASLQMRERGWDRTTPRANAHPKSALSLGERTLECATNMPGSNTLNVGTQPPHCRPAGACQ